MDDYSIPGRRCFYFDEGYEICIRGKNVPAYLNGVRVEIWKDDLYIGTATVGGFITVGERTLALTVAHAFYPREPSLSIQPVDIIEGSGSDFYPNGGNVSNPTYQYLEQPQAERIISSNLCTGESVPQTPFRSDEVRTTIGRPWGISSIYEKRSQALDWALLHITHPSIKRENLSPFWNEKLDSFMLKWEIGILTASHTIGTKLVSSAIFKSLLDTSPQPVTVAVDGFTTPADAGAWAIRTSGKRLVGMLVDSCPSLKKSYFLHIRHILQDIQMQTGIKPIEIGPDTSMMIRFPSIGRPF
ncbi:hypothetical protein F5Y09DRAFT_13150 [Xylaria sp. FL1042]|nr:hypothetical protein F5Y09DRAFT_13150 [Xylaria sp. FL1042]